MAFVVPQAAEAVDKVYRHLKRQILRLTLSSHTRIRAQEVAAALGVSRTPVREAMARLERDGLLERVGGWGYAVRAITGKEAADLFAVRQSLERQVIRQVIPKLSTPVLETLASLLHQQAQCLSEGRVEGFREKSRGFHLVLLSTADNDVLKKLLLSIDDQVRLIGAIIHGSSVDRAREVLLENQSLYEALAAHDVVAAEQAVEQHLLRAMSAALLHLESEALSRAIHHDMQFTEDIQEETR